MKYTGGKTRIAARLSAAILAESENRAEYIEPFLGSAAVAVKVAPHFRTVKLSDTMPDLILMWQELADGWEPPLVVTEAEFREQKYAAPSALRGFTGFACSFAGKWFGGLARGDNRNFADEGRRSVLKRSAALVGAHLACQDYREVAPSAGSVVYCDPPYAGTLGYAGSGKFDSNEFWRTAQGWAEAGAMVLVSEYAAPPGWVSVWSHTRHVSTALNNAGETATEHLWKYAGTGASFNNRKETTTTMGSWTKKSDAAGGGEFKRIELKEGESFEGRYSGPRDITGVNGDFTSHEFEQEGSDEVHTISGAALNRGLAGVEPGTLTRLTFRGMVITKAKRTCKSYDVEVYAEDSGAAKKSF